VDELGLFYCGFCTFSNKLLSTPFLTLFFLIRHCASLLHFAPYNTARLGLLTMSRAVANCHSCVSMKWCLDLGPFNFWICPSWTKMRRKSKWTVLNPPRIVKKPLPPKQTHPPGPGTNTTSQYWRRCSTTSSSSGSSSSSSNGGDSSSDTPTWGSTLPRATSHVWVQCEELESATAKWLEETTAWTEQLSSQTEVQKSARHLQPASAANAELHEKINAITKAIQSTTRSYLTRRSQPTTNPTKSTP
jgi:hypothetical protein